MGENLVNIEKRKLENSYKSKKLKLEGNLGMLLVLLEILR